LFDPDEIDKEIQSKAEGHHFVTMDPLTSDKNVSRFEASRLHTIDGTQSIKQVASPGNPSLDEQSEIIARNVKNDERVSGKAIKVATGEDDLFSGLTLETSVRKMSSHGVNVTKVIPGIQVGESGVFKKQGIIVDPVVKYSLEGEGEIFEKVDLGDGRDFLPGMDGLVVLLPDGSYGRAPYVLPSVSTATRAGILPDREQEFSINVLSLSYKFYSNIEDELGVPIRLKDVHPAAIAYYQYLGYDPDTSMKDIIAYTISHFDELWKDNQLIGNQQKEKLAKAI
jgi:hypothetical protein